KELSNDSLTVHGGPSAPAYIKPCQDFFDRYAHVDIVVRGEGEITMLELFSELAQHKESTDRTFFGKINGLSYRSVSTVKGPVVRTPDRSRIEDLNQLPSPYQNGFFEKEDTTAWTAAILETNRGCPYNCTFCDWGNATMQKIRQFDLDRVYKDIEWIAINKVAVLFMADSNFGIFHRDVEVATAIAEIRKRYDYPKQVVVNYAKNATERLAEVVRIFNTAGVTAQGIISMQTQDPQTLMNVSRSNISTKKYEELLAIFRNEKLPISSDLMIGLPGATVQSFKNDLQFFF